jgi:hypothetical protein
MALLLRETGWACRVLGARAPTITVATAAKATGAAGVIVISHLATGRRRAVESIRAIDRMAIPVFYAGNAFVTPRSRSTVPGNYLGLRIQDACSLVVKTLTLDDPANRPAAQSP